MAARDTLVTEVASALALVGLLLVFLPLFLDALGRARGGNVPWRKLRLMKLRPWLVAIAVAIGAADATAGLLTLWGVCSLATLTAVLQLVLLWFVVGLVVLASAYGR